MSCSCEFLICSNKSPVYVPCNTSFVVQLVQYIHTYVHVYVHVYIFFHKLRVLLISFFISIFFHTHRAAVGNNGIEVIIESRHPIIIDHLYIKNWFISFFSKRPPDLSLNQYVSIFWLYTTQVTCRSWFAGKFDICNWVCCSSDNSYPFFSVRCSSVSWSCPPYTKKILKLCSGIITFSYLNMDILIYQSLFSFLVFTYGIYCIYMTIIAVNSDISNCKNT